MTSTMYIGSGDVSALLAGKKTKSHASLMQRFVSGIKPYYNAKNSPIDALRTGAILEDRYLLILPDCYFSQYSVQSSEMDVFKATLDFAKLDKGKVIDFDELKSIGFSDFLEFMPLSEEERLAYVRKNYKNYYNQTQEQLYCTELESCNLSFLSVTSYDDEVNYNRIIEEHEILKIRIRRDEEVISLIKERGSIFQQIKDYYKK